MEIKAKNFSVNLEIYKNIRDNEKTGCSSKQISGEISKEDKVVLSSEARENQKAKKILNSLPDIREEKVAYLKNEIKNGTYQIKGEEIAVKMLQDSLFSTMV